MIHSLLLPLLLLMGVDVMAASETSVYPEIAAMVEECRSDFESIPEERRADLELIADYVREHVDANDDARLIFICTHNSRRSHMAQIWAQTAATVYGVDGVKTYSGGTEATAFNPRAVQSMQRAGFRIEATGPDDNPRYQVRMGPGQPPVEAWSKVYDSEENPQEDFAAVMVCSHADANCPFVPGATLRIAIPYVDPKEADGTAEEAATYDARNRQISTEMLYVFSRVRS